MAFILPKTARKSKRKEIEANFKKINLRKKIECSFWRNYSKKLLAIKKPKALRKLSDKILQLKFIDLEKFSCIKILNLKKVKLFRNREEIKKINKF